MIDVFAIAGAIGRDTMPYVSVDTMKKNDWGFKILD
jgi:hypothetical protein